MCIQHVYTENSVMKIRHKLCLGVPAVCNAQCLAVQAKPFSVHGVVSCVCNFEALPAVGCAANNLCSQYRDRPTSSQSHTADTQCSSAAIAIDCAATRGLVGLQDAATSKQQEPAAPSLTSDRTVPTLGL